MLRRRRRNDRSGRVLVAALAMLVVVLCGALAVPVSGMSTPPRETRRTDRTEALRQKVLATVETRMNDAKAREKIREKLDVLEGRNLRLAAALCDRIAEEQGSAGSDIAFSLVTALIVLA